MNYVRVELNGDISLLIGCLELGGSGLQGLHYLGVTIALGYTQRSPSLGPPLPYMTRR